MGKRLLCTSSVEFIADADWTELKDTYRAAWAWQILLSPERIPGMVQSMLNDYREVSKVMSSCCRPATTGSSGRTGGWLPMWKNIVGEL